jgi:rod shape-determining protein MreB
MAYKPLKDGVIADIDVTTLMLNDFMRKTDLISFVNRPSALICVPQGVTTVEKRAVENAAYDAGAKTVATMAEPMAAAIGVGIDVNAPEGNMIVDIGGGTTEIAVLSLGGIVSNSSIKMAGDDFTNDIQEYMSRQHNVRVSERMAERIKIAVGAALTDLPGETPEDYVVYGPNRITAMPMEVPVCYQEIAHCLEKSIARIEQAVINALESTPPELYADIVKNGIWLTGGGALLRGLDKRLTDKINIPFHVAKDPLLCVARGTGIALKNVDNFTFLMR